MGIPLLEWSAELECYKMQQKRHSHVCISCNDIDENVCSHRGWKWWAEGWCYEAGGAHTRQATIAAAIATPAQEGAFDALSAASIFGNVLLCFGLVSFWTEILFISCVGARMCISWNVLPHLTPRIFFFFFSMPMFWQELFLFICFLLLHQPAMCH